MKLWGRGLAEVGAKRLYCGRRRLVYVGEGVGVWERGIGVGGGGLGCGGGEVAFEKERA